MNAVRWIRGAAALAWLAAGAAGAAEITLYEDPGFGGAQLTLRGYTPDIRNTGFNDRTSSIVVTSGRWEVCSDVDFKGRCTTLMRGEYPNLDRSLNDRISSAREVGSYGANRGSYNDYGRGAIELYGQPDFRGRSLQLDRDAPTLEGTGFNDRASSVVVTSGTWELCADNGYAGSCRVYPPGRYSDLGYGMARQISSARLVRSPRDAPAVLRPGDGGVAAVPAAGPGRVILYGREGLNGRSVAVAGAVVDMERTGLRDGAVSAYVESGSWLLCADPNFAGACVVVGPGRYDSLGASGLARPVSSVRPAAPAPVAAGRPDAAPRPAPGATRPDGLELFSEPDFGGERVGIERDTGALDRANFNDRAASAIIYAGQWEFCVDTDYRGACSVFGPGRYPRLGGLTKQLSSLRRLQ